MSAHQLMSRMLDELMGTRRNGENLHKTNLHFSSTRVCKSFLLNCCPHEILANTRFNLGKCPKVHDVALKADFEKSRDHEYEFQVEAHQFLHNFILECKRRTQIAKLRLAAAQDALNTQKTKQLAYIRQIDVKINTEICEAEKLGALGDVEEALSLMKEVDILKQEKAKSVSDFRNATPASHDQQKKLRICEVCSSYLGLDDGDKRLADHFTGKLHLGFLYIKEKYKDLERLIQERCIKVVLENEFQSSVNLKRSRSPALESINESSENGEYGFRKKLKSMKNATERFAGSIQLNLNPPFSAQNIKMKKSNL